MSGAIQFGWRGVRRWLQTEQRDTEVVALAALRLNLRRVQGFAVLMLLLNLVPIVRLDAPARWLLAAQTGVLIVALLLARWAARALPGRARVGRAALLVVLINGVANTLLPPFDVNGPPPDTLPMLAAFTHAVVFLLRPAWSLPLYGLSAGLGLLAPFAPQLASVPEVVMPNVFGLIISLMLWRQFVRRERLQMELLAQKAHLEELVVRDPLTGLYNRVEFERRAMAELARMQRQGGSTSLILLDLDHFKRINDQHGHPAGDAVLVWVAQQLRQSARVTDVAARLGGEEFVVLLPGTDAPAARATAQRLCQQIDRRLELTGPGAGVAVSASFGVATVDAPAPASGFGALYVAADRALYKAKGAGRNRVESA